MCTMDSTQTTAKWMMSGFDAFSAVYTLSISRTSDNCEDIASDTGNIVTFERGSKSKFELNINTFASAVAVNLKELPIDYLEESEVAFSITYQSKSYDVSEYYDTKYQGTDGMLCLQSDTAEDWSPFCFMSASEKVYIPVLHHYNDTCNEPCKNNNFGDWSVVCDALDLEVTLLRVPGASSQSSITNAMDLIDKFSYRELTVMVAEAFEHGTGAELFDDCANCTLVTINTWQDSAKYTPYDLDIPAIHCSDPFAADTMKTLGENPPVQLVETYLECTQSNFNAFVTAVSVAVGNMSVAAYVVILVVLIIFLLAIYLFQEKPKGDTFSDVEETLAHEEFIFALLEINKGEMKHIKRGGVLEQIVAELRHLNKHSFDDRGFSRTVSTAASGRLQMGGTEPGPQQYGNSRVSAENALESSAVDDDDNDDGEDDTNQELGRVEYTQVPSN